MGLAERFVADVAPASLLEVHDPQHAVKDVEQGTHSFAAVAAGVFGHRTVFAKVRQADLVWWLPVDVEIREPLEIRHASLDQDRAEVQFVVANNTDRRIDNQAAIACGGSQEASANVHGASPAQSAAIAMPVSRLLPGTNPISVDVGSEQRVSGAVVNWDVKPDLSAMGLGWECIDLTKFFNDQVTQIFSHQYRSPRSPYCSLQIPINGIGDWCNYAGGAEFGDRSPKGSRTKNRLDDSEIREVASSDGKYVSPQGIRFVTPGRGDQPNIIFTSQWDNFPREVLIPLQGHAYKMYFLVTGSTNLMQSQMDNGEIIVQYADGATARLALHNPTTWWPIEQDYDVEKDKFCIPGPYPPRITLGRAAKATLLDLPVEHDKELQSLTLRTLANEVVVGLMGVTLVCKE